MVDSYPINDIYFGKGMMNVSPSGFVIHGTGGLGSDVAGGNITFYDASCRKTTVKMTHTNLIKRSNYLQFNILNKAEICTNFI